MKIEASKQYEFSLEPSLKFQRGSNERALRLKQVCQLTGLGRSMIYQMQAEKRFPQRIKLGERAVGTNCGRGIDGNSDNATVQATEKSSYKLETRRIN